MKMDGQLWAELFLLTQALSKLEMFATVFISLIESF
jgi:hypothetical protein